VRPLVVALALSSACRAAPEDSTHEARGRVETAAVATAETFDARVARVHREALVVDGHDDIPTILAKTGGDLDAPRAKTSTDLAKLEAGGLTAEFFSIFVHRSYAEHPSSSGGGATRRALDLIELTYREVERHPDHLVLARSVEDIRRAKGEGRVAILMGIEGGHAIENSLATLRDFHRLGVRYMTLTHTNTNDWADSSGSFGPVPVLHHGLTPFGQEVVREMQRIGMLVDVSHVSDETFFDVLDVAKAPIIASHSSARALVDDRRNLSDAMLRALADNGGVCMVNFWPEYLDPAVVAARARGAPPPRTPISVVVDHIDHIVKIAGIDHVGLGSDFDGVDALPVGLGGVDELPNLTRALLERGYSDDDAKKILGENFLRVFEAAEAFTRTSSSR